MDMSMHCNPEKTAEAKRIIEAERLREEGGAKCFVVMESPEGLSQVRDGKVQTVEAQMKEKDMPQLSKD